MKISPTEQNIINLLKKSDKRALNLLYEHYSNSLYGVIVKIRINEEIAKDALQEIFNELPRRRAIEVSSGKRFF